MKMSKPELQDIIRKQSKDLPPKRRVQISSEFYAREEASSSRVSLSQRRHPSLSAKGWRPGSPEFPSDEESGGEPKKVSYQPLSRASHSHSMVIHSERKFSNIKEKSESNHSEES